MRTTRTLVAQRPTPRLVGIRTLRAYAKARRQRYRLLAAAVALGIVFMVIHWG
ncbi:MAG TPA: hypothetical protein VLT47_06140 [Anaeromyxobacteraceae bacterium]|nr:hypothetical protein [Anaeromyxobacteraceae bacterium]